MATLPSWPIRTSSVCDNGVVIRKDMQEYAERLFEKERPVDVETAVVDENGFKTERLESTARISKYFEETLPDERIKSSTSALFCLLSPGYGWGPLHNTRDGMLSILSALKVFPEFYRYLRVFGLEDFPKDEGFGGFDFSSTVTATGKLSAFESCYVLKRVELKTDKSKKNPWSLRHTVVYQNVLVDKRRSNHILLRLSSEMSRRLGGALTGDKNSADHLTENWTDLHLMCWSSVEDGWRKYVNYLDEEVHKIYTRVVIAEVDPKHLKEIDSAERSSKDMRALQVLTDQALRTAHMIDVNIETITCMTEALDELVQDDKRTSMIATIPEFRKKMLKIQQEHRFQHKNVSSLVARAQTLAGQLRDTVSLRNSEMNRLNTELSNKNTIALLELSDRASQETHVVKTLTILALVFVPASFSADFLQMGYISVKEGTRFTLAATRDLQIYAVLAIPLVAVTMLIYTLVEMGKNRALNRRLAKIRKASV